MKKFALPLEIFKASEGVWVNSDDENPQEKLGAPPFYTKTLSNAMNIVVDEKGEHSFNLGTTVNNTPTAIPQPKLTPEGYKRLPVATKRSRRNKKFRRIQKDWKKSNVNVANMFTSFVISLARERNTTRNSTPSVKPAGKKEESTDVPSTGFGKELMLKGGLSESLSDALKWTSINRDDIQTELRKPSDSKQKKYQLIEKLVTIMKDDVVQAEDIEILLKELNVKVTKASKSGDNQSAATLSYCGNCNAKTKSSSNKYIYNEDEEKVSGVFSSTCSTSGVSLSLTDIFAPSLNSDSRDDGSEDYFDLSLISVEASH